MDHDRNFKELISAFFIEFVALFLPDVAQYLDPDFAIVPLDKEMFGDLALGESLEVDLLMKVKFRGRDAYFLIHVENQASRQIDFPKRLFRYFALLTLKFDLPVYPVVVFSYDTPLSPEPSRYEVVFPGRTVLSFEYVVVQLNQLSWRDYLRRDNPLATALMDACENAQAGLSPATHPRIA